jgi:hypothetical protein
MLLGDDGTGKSISGETAGTSLNWPLRSPHQG